VDTGLKPLCSLARGLQQDFDAVAAGLTLEWSSGKVEGNVNRVKRIKRDGYGRAGFDLLRRQILLQLSALTLRDRATRSGSEPYLLTAVTVALIYPVAERPGSHMTDVSRRGPGAR
jgi:hypothetical protein